MSLQGGDGGWLLGWDDLDLGSSPRWWAATVAAYCPSRMVEHPKSKSTQPSNQPPSPPCISNALPALPAVLIALWNKITRFLEWHWWFWHYNSGIQISHLINIPDSHNGQARWKTVLSSCLSIVPVRFVNKPDRHDGLPKFDPKKLHGVVCNPLGTSVNFFGSNLGKPSC